MPMNKQKGNMYGFLTHTWNPIRGCKNNCAYCYLKAIEGLDLAPRFAEKEVYTHLGEDNFIFVGSSGDMFEYWVPNDWISKVLIQCSEYNNRYLFQSRNPGRIGLFESILPERSIAGTTIETNRIKLAHKYSECFKTVRDRYNDLKKLKGIVPLMVSVEPILDFDVDKLLEWVVDLDPEFIVVGADSKGHKLEEPEGAKVREFIEEAKKHTKVFEKTNLGRLFLDQAIL